MLRCSSCASRTNPDGLSNYRTTNPFSNSGSSLPQSVSLAHIPRNTQHPHTRQPPSTPRFKHHGHASLLNHLGIRALWALRPTPLRHRHDCRLGPNVPGPLQGEALQRTALHRERRFRRPIRQQRPVQHPHAALVAEIALQRRALVRNARPHAQLGPHIIGQGPHSLGGEDGRRAER